MNAEPNSFKRWLFKEIRSVVFTTGYFAIWFGVLMFLKMMILTEYKVEFTGLPMALIGAFILAKVVLFVDHIPLSNWTREHSAIYYIIFRTSFVIIAVFITLLLEKAFDARHEYGGFGSALSLVFQHANIYHVWASVTVVGIAVFWFNVLFVLRRYLGTQKIKQLFFSIPLTEVLSKEKDLQSA